MKLAVIVLIGLLVSCSQVPLKPETPFQLSERDYLYKIADWSFSGRLAMSDKSNSLSASVVWKHQKHQDQIELAGPFGRGRTLISLTENSVVIDDGDERLNYYGNVDDIVTQQLGLRLPVSALKYWVLGLVEPNIDYTNFENGFLQSGWKIQYQQMQFVENNQLPRKLKIEKHKSKLKLIIQHWEL
jgi:outer membrane lipoprotein LolB